MQWNVDDKTSQPNHENHQSLSSCIRATAHLPALKLIGPAEFNLQLKVNSHRTTKYENDHFLITFCKEYNDACMPTLFFKFTMLTTTWAEIGWGNFTEKKRFIFHICFFAMFLFSKQGSTYFLSLISTREVLLCMDYTDIYGPKGCKSKSQVLNRVQAQAPFGWVGIRVRRLWPLSHSFICKLGSLSATFQIDDISQNRYSQNVIFTIMHWKCFSVVFARCFWDRQLKW